ncbi:hypothetical protein GCM10010430_69420 [Kitasatospora cystarginea]|uniref:Glyoxalase-like domain-containing protein n=1 Tax=Kitasatospora cystarginea TaxID=58350 RepID=A0ABN3EVM3_9ACTN
MPSWRREGDLPAARALQQVDDLTATLAWTRAAGAQVPWGPRPSGGRDSALVQFPGGYVAELHDPRPGR